MKNVSALVLAALATTPTLAASDEWKMALEAALKADTEFTKLSLHGSISKIGSKFTLKAENIQAMPTDGFLPNINVIENGVRKEANIGARALTGILNASTRKTQGMQIEPGSQVGILRVDVTKDSVLMQVVTLKAEKITLRGDTESEYLHTWLQFRFRGLETMDPATIKRVVYEVIVPEQPSVQAPSSPALPSASVPVATLSAQTAVPPGGNNALIGKTAGEVQTLLGPPNATVEAGGQIILVYSGLNLRVGLRDGKVVSVQ